MRKSTKALKALVISALGVLLLTLSVSSPFAWFNRPQSKTGGSLSLSIPYGDKDPNGNDIPMKAYDGKNLTMATYLSTDDAISFSETAADPATNVTGLQPNKRYYYKTEITNTGATEQKVSLYLKNFTPGTQSGTNVCVGVNYPIKAFKNYTMYDQTIPPATKNRKNGTVKRVYFEPTNRIPSGNNYDGTRSNWANKTYYVVSGTASTDIDSNRGSNATYTQMHSTTTSGVYYADIPLDHNKLYFVVQNWTEDYQRTQTFTNLNGDGLTQVQSLIFYLNGTYNDFNNVWAGKENVTGACFAGYYNSISLSVGQTIDAGLVLHSDYGGQSISYTSSNTSKFTVSTNGTITAVAAGSGTLTYTITSSKGDTVSKTANVVVHGYDVSSTTIANAPIVTNLSVPANGKTEVWWFIQNGDEEYFESTANASYTHEGLFLSV